MGYRNEWFDGRQSLKAPPLEAVLDCTRPGDNCDAVSFWVDRLGFDGPAWLFRDYLKDSGAWEAGELCDHGENRQRVFWMLCHQLKDEGDGEEDRELPATFYLGA